MTIHFLQCISLSKRLVFAKSWIITSLAFILAKNISDRSSAPENFPEGCIWFSLQELNSPNGKKINDDEKLPVVGNTPVINNYVEWVLNLLLKDWFYLECILSALRGVHLMAALWKVFSRGRWPHRLFLRKPRRNILRDVFQGAFLPKCYWDTGLRPVLTHGSIKWSFCVNIQTAMGYFKPGFFFSNLMICKFCND